MAFKTLNQKLIVMLLIPVSLLLLGLGVAGFFYSRENLLNSWKETALFSMERAAHAIDMRLARPEESLELISSIAGLSAWSQSQWEGELSKVPGVVRVKLEMAQTSTPEPVHGGRMRGRGASMGQGPGQEFMRGRWFHRAHATKISSPILDPDSGQRTVTLLFELKDANDKPVGKLNVVMSFDYLLQDIKALSWWQSDQVCLVDDNGVFLAHSVRGKWQADRLGQSGDQLELKTLEAMKHARSGTLLGPGHPAERVAGFYRLDEAPWTVVTFGQGDLVLAPVVDFLRRYLVVGLICIALVMLIIRLVTGRLAASVKKISKAAEDVARGEYCCVPQVKGQDEIGRMAESFNVMVEGLKEREQIRKTFGRYMDPEIAKQLLSGPQAGRLGGDKREVAIMMTDIRGFTPLCERLSPEETITVVNRYLSQVIAVIQKHQGIIVDFLGDAVLVFFDTVTDDIVQACRRAVCCALDLKEVTDEFNKNAQSEGLPELATGIGLHAGEVVVGNIGSEDRAKYGIVGGPVNVTHRVQSQAQGGQIVASRDLVEKLPQDFEFGNTFTAQLKGVESEKTLYLVQGLSRCAQ